jgi:hypothetical protein
LRKKGSQKSQQGGVELRLRGWKWCVDGAAKVLPADKEINQKRSYRCLLHRLFMRESRSGHSITGESSMQKSQSAEQNCKPDFILMKPIIK